MLCSVGAGLCCGSIMLDAENLALRDCYVAGCNKESRQKSHHNNDKDKDKARGIGTCEMDSSLVELIDSFLLTGPA